MYSTMVNIKKVLKIAVCFTDHWSIPGFANRLKEDGLRMYWTHIEIEIILERSIDISAIYKSVKLLVPMQIPGAHKVMF